MKRTVLLFIVIVLACINTANGQQKRLDSILALNNSYHQEDSVKAIYLREVFRAYNSVKNYAKVQVYVDSAILIASRLPRKNALAAVYYRVGSMYHNSDRFKAISYYQKSIETARLSGGLKIEAGAHLNLGALYMGINDYPKSLEAHENALQIFARLGDEGGMSSCYMNMASIHNQMGQKTKALEYTRKALTVFEKGDSERGIAIAYDGIADFFFTAPDKDLVAMGIAPANRQKEIANALDKGLKKALLSDDHSVIAGFYRNMGKLNELQGNIMAAQQNYKKSIDVNEGDIEEDSYQDNLVAAGNFYIDKIKDFSKGIGMLHEALISSQKMGRLGSEEAALAALSNAHEKNRNYDSALFYFRKAIVVKDTIHSQEREQEVTRKQLKIDFDIKEKDYKSAQQLADARMKQQEQEILLRRQQLLISDKEKTLQRLTFLQKQAELESQKKLQSTQLKQEQQKAEFDKKTRDQQINVQNVQLTSNKRLSVFLAVLAVIVFAVAMFIYNSRQKTMKLNKMVSEQKVALEELVGVKDKIFSIVSHDMRTPVNNIIAFSSLLEEGEIEQQRLALYVEQIKGTLDHTSSLLENLLNWAASQMQGFTPVIEDVNITPIVQQTLQGASQALTRKKITVNNSVAGNIFVKGDMNMVELIVRNIVNNAVKFSNTGGILGISVTHDGSKAILSVSDNGIGIDDRKVALINSASTNSIQSTTGTGKEKGTGLGLMLCKHFAMMMNGSIYVESKPKLGSVFNIALPAA